MQIAMRSFETDGTDAGVLGDVLGRLSMSRTHPVSKGLV